MHVQLKRTAKAFCQVTVQWRKPWSSHSRRIAPTFLAKWPHESSHPARLKSLMVTGGPVFPIRRAAKKTHLLWLLWDIICHKRFLDISDMKRLKWGPGNGFKKSLLRWECKWQWRPVAHVGRSTDSHWLINIFQPWAIPTCPNLSSENCWPSPIPNTLFCFRFPPAPRPPCLFGQTSNDNMAALHQNYRNVESLGPQLQSCINLQHGGFTATQLPHFSVPQSV
jgi:hypothetical protein